MRVAIFALVIAVAACSGPPARERTVAEFMEDSAVLQGELAHCAEDKRAAAKDPECTNARIALERLAVQEEARRASEHEAEFEKSRELLRQQREAERRAAEARKKTKSFDPYSSPVSIEPAPAPPSS
jgi:hypothetical protein